MLRKIVLVAIFQCAIILLFAQKNELKETIETSLGLSRHGTDDLAGFILNTEFRKYFKEKLFYTVGLGATWNDGSMEVYYTEPGGKVIDASIRNAIAGFQLTSKVGWDFFQDNNSSLGVAIGPVIRYQSSTVPDFTNVIYPAAGTGLPYPVATFAHYDPQRTLSIGGLIQFTYRYKIGSRLFTGAVAGFQTDSNGDAIPHLCGVVGIKL